MTVFARIKQDIVAKYTKPVGGIPKTDLAAVVQNGLVDPDSVGYDVIPVLGQSNAAGRGSVIDTTRFDAPVAGVDVYPSAGTYAGQILRATEPMAAYAADAAIVSGSNLGVSFALEFTRWYSRSISPNRRVLLVPCAYGGTGLSTPDTYGTSLTWQPGTVDSNNLFERAVATVTAALAAAGENARIPLVLWHQGEQDGNNNRTTNQYAADLDALIDAVRSRLGADLPFVLGQMTAETVAVSKFGLINAAHVATPVRKPRTGVAASPGTGFTDPSNGTLHFSSAGQRILGRNYFRAYRAAVYNVLGTPPLPPAAPTVTQTGATTASVTWVPPLARSTDYNVRYSTDNGATWTDLARAPSTAPSATITGLTAGQQLIAQVRSVNEQGSSVWSPSSAPLTVAAAPGQVTGLTAGSATSSTQPLTWNPTPGATSYVVEYKRTSDSSWTTFGTVADTAATVSPLSGSTSYDYRVSARNVAGTGTPSATVSGTTLAPTDMTTGLLRKYTAATSVNDGIADGAAVASVADTSGTGGAAISQATAGARPTLKANAVNGRPAWVFDGGDDVLTDTAFTRGQLASTVVVVGKWVSGQPASGAMLSLVASASGTSPVRRQILGVYSTNGTDKAWAANFGTVLSSGTAVDSGFHMIMGDQTATGGTGRASVDFTNEASGTIGLSGTTTSRSGISVGNVPEGTGGLGAEIAEVRVYDHVLTTAEKNALRAYFQSIYATP
jgi:hypothetical protein